MLHKSAVSLDLLGVLSELQEVACSEGFALAGGTSLALRFGHRLSADLDYFTVSDFDPQSLADRLGYSVESITGLAGGTLQLRINGIKVEFLRHAYPMLSAHDRIQGVKMWSVQDVAAMKLNAISNRGSKKDFFDLSVLLEHFSLPALLDFYQQKYRPASLMMVIRSLAWFEDADTEPDPVSLRDESWPTVVEKIKNAVRGLT